MPIPDSPDDSEREEHDEEGTLSPEELESRNQDRALVVIARDEAEVTIRTDGGVDISRLFDEQAENIQQIVTRLIVLAVLLVLMLLLWRIGTLSHVLRLIT